jgi:hypothetical protein
MMVRGGAQGEHAIPVKIQTDLEYASCMSVGDPSDFLAIHTYHLQEIAVNGDRLILITKHNVNQVWNIWKMDQYRR